MGSGHFPKDAVGQQHGKTIALDFDGVLHPYTDGWQGSTPVDEPPVPGVIEFLATLHELGYSLVVFSTRADHDEGRDGIINWLAKYGLTDYITGVTHTKVGAIAYVDDRAVPFLGDWDSVLHGVHRLAERKVEGRIRYCIYCGTSYVIPPGMTDKVDVDSMYEGGHTEEPTSVKIGVWNGGWWWDEIVVVHRCENRKPVSVDTPWHPLG